MQLDVIRRAVFLRNNDGLPDLRMNPQRGRPASVLQKSFVPDGNLSGCWRCPRMNRIAAPPSVLLAGNFSAGIERHTVYVIRAVRH
jgi:hypothetical protein